MAEVINIQALSLDDHAEKAGYTDDLVRASYFDPKQERFAKFANFNIAILGGGTAGTATLEGIIFRGGGRGPRGSVFGWEGGEVGPENGYAGPGRSWIGRKKADYLNSQIAERLSDEELLRGNVRYYDHFLSSAEEVFRVRPDVVILAFDSVYHMVTVAELALQKGKTVIQNTDLNDGAVLSDIYRPGQPLFRDRVHPQVIQAIKAIGPKPLEKHSPTEAKVRMAFVAQLVGIDNLSADMCKAMLYTMKLNMEGKPTSFPQTSNSAHLLRNIAPIQVWALANNIPMKDRVLLDIRTQLYTPERVAYENEQNQIWQGILMKALMG
jgi:hypothetical protein